MTTTTKLTLVTAGLICSALLSGCGNKAEEETAKATAEAEQKAAEAKAAAEHAAEETAQKMEQLKEIAAEQAADDEHPTIEGECGGEVEGQQMCPMEKWMEENTKAAVENRDLKALAAALHKMEFMSPTEEWNEGENGWAKIARRGAVAAEKGNFKEARASCKSCHKAYKEDFQATYRKRLMPELPAEADKGRTDLEI